MLVQKVIQDWGFRNFHLTDGGHLECYFSDAFIFLFPMLQIKGRRSQLGLLNQNALVSRTTIKTAILQTAGPVSTCQAIRCNWRFLRCIRKEQFAAAAVELEKANFGSFIAVGANRKVFVKKHPEIVNQDLVNHPNLCFPDIYSARYHLPPTKLISWAIRSQLVNMGLVTKEQVM